MGNVREADLTHPTTRDGNAATCVARNSTFQQMATAPPRGFGTCRRPVLNLTQRAAVVPGQEGGARARTGVPTLFPP